MKNSMIPQHKKLAMGQTPGFKVGGFVPSADRKTGIPDTPIEKAKRANGVPGMKKGGKNCA